jgi:hypothetical protein
MGVVAEVRIDLVDLKERKSGDVFMREPEQGYVTFPLQEGLPPVVFPRLRAIQNWAMQFGSEVPVGMTCSSGNCPLSNALSFLLGDQWIVSKEGILRLDRRQSVIAQYQPPLLYSQFIERVDALSPRKTEEQRSQPQEGDEGAERKSIAVVASMVIRLIDEVLSA